MVKFPLRRRHQREWDDKMPSTVLKERLLSPEEILDLFTGLQPDPAWSFAECTPRDTCRLTHGYHRYPAKFIPQIVDKLLDSYTDPRRPTVVNDLFMGSGTTIACAIERGYRATGTDINEVACLITRAKSTPLDPEKLERRRLWLYERLRPLDDGYVSNGVLPAILPQSERIDTWFPERQKHELGQILAALMEIEDEDERNFFLCCFSHILKNCSFWHMGSTKPARDLSREPRRPWPTFLVHLQKMSDRNRAFWHTVPPAVRTHIHEYLDVRCHDARQLPFPDNSTDIQITSPPYVTSYEYADLHQLTALWLHYVHDLRDFRQKFIGTSRPTNHRPYHGHSEIAEEILAQMEKADAGLVPSIRRFFSDMSECFSESYRILKPGGRACYVIGNTQLKGVAVRNAEVFVELMQEAGFILERVIKRQIPSKILPQRRDPNTGRFVSHQIPQCIEAYPVEYIIIMRKP